MKIPTRIFAIIWGLLLFQAASAQSVEQIMRHYYPKYSKENQCFIGKGVDSYAESGSAYGDFCLKTDAQKTVETARGKMRYILLTGQAIDLSSNSFVSGHVTVGMVSMFVLRAVGQNDWEVVAQGSTDAGAWGNAPQGWRLHRFGTDTWGFLNRAGDMHQGWGGSYYVILLPVGKTIHDSRIMSDADNEGALGECSVDEGYQTKSEQKDCLSRRYHLSSTLKIDRSAPTVGGMYPLKLWVSGYSGSKKYTNHLITIPFDERTKRYPDLKSSPLFKLGF